MTTPTTDVSAVSDDALYPRWYLTLRVFVSGLAFGVTGAALYFEPGFWQAAGSLRLNVFTVVVGGALAVSSALFEIFFRLRRHLRLQRRTGLAA